MKSVIVRPRFQCDFCNRRSVKHVIARHEPTCYLNPNRICAMCHGTGTIKDYSYDDERPVLFDCRYCKTYEEVKKQLKESEAYESFVGTDPDIEKDPPF